MDCRLKPGNDELNAPSGNLSLRALMDPVVFAAVLFAAACHAAWNAVIKFGLDPFTTTALIAVGSGLVAAPLVVVFGLPPAPAWPWAAASMVLHFGYFVGLTEAYRTGDMGQVYPIARGAAPLLTAAGSALLIAEPLGPLAWCGIAVLAGGIFLMSLRGGRGLPHIDRRAVGFALFTAVTIAGYSLTDGMGARAAGNAHSYTAILFVGDGLMMAAFALIRRGPGVLVDAARYWKSGLIGGTLSLVAYWIAIWAMTIAPIAIVAALRETSVLFGALIAVVVLKEPLRASRIAAAVLIVSGLALIRLQ
jgi:drug/metabolite transporter (DMT)-like permease